MGGGGGAEGAFVAEIGGKRGGISRGSPLRGRECRRAGEAMCVMTSSSLGVAEDGAMALMGSDGLRVRGGGGGYGGFIGPPEPVGCALREGVR